MPEVLPMALKRTSVQLDTKDLAVLTKQARAESEATGSRVTIAQLIRRLIRQSVLERRGK